MNCDPRLLDVLEPGQLASASDRPLPRRKLGRFAYGLLVLLRLYVLIAVPVVGYAFFHALMASQP